MLWSHPARLRSNEAGYVGISRQPAANYRDFWFGRALDSPGQPLDADCQGPNADECSRSLYIILISGEHGASLNTKRRGATRVQHTRGGPASRPATAEMSPTQVLDWIDALGHASGWDLSFAYTVSLLSWLRLLLRVGMLLSGALLIYTVMPWPTRISSRNVSDLVWGVGAMASGQCA